MIRHRHPSFQHKTSRTGFSLVEILAALALSTMLLVVVMGLTARIALTNKKLVAKYPDLSWQTVLAENLQTDFENCRSITAGSKQIEFSGYSLPRSTDVSIVDELPVAHIPTRIVYRIENAEKGSWLIRTEYWGNSEFSSKAYMGRGIQGFELVDRLDTDVAPSIFRVALLGQAFGSEQKLNLSLVRYGSQTQ